MTRALIAPALTRAIALAAAIVVAAPGVGQTVLFEENFETDDGMVVQAFTNGAVGTTGWQYQVGFANQNDARFGYDYSAINIPEAPNTKPGDAATTGVSLRANVSQGVVDQAGLFYEDSSWTGQYQVKVDMYLSWAFDGAAIGTTEHGGLFIGSDTATNPANPTYPSSTGAGVILSTDGDTSNFDHTILKNDIYPSTASGQFSVTDFGFGPQLGYDNTDVNTDPAFGDLIDLPALYPQIDLGGGNIQNAGAAGFRWVTLTADVDTDAIGNGTGTEPGLTTFSVTIADSGETYTIGTLDNSVIDDVNDGPLTGFDIETEQGPVNMAGRATLVLIDFFTSVASDIDLATAVFDNFVVTAVDSGTPGDYNGDGSVDAADYTLWRDGDPSATPGPAGYTEWETNYTGTPSPASSVPEPTALAALLMAASLAAASRRRAGC